MNNLKMNDDYKWNVQVSYNSSDINTQKVIKEESLNNF